MPNLSWEFIEEILHDVKRLESEISDINIKVKVLNGAVRKTIEKINNKIEEVEK